MKLLNGKNQAIGIISVALSTIGLGLSGCNVSGSATVTVTASPAATASPAPVPSPTASAQSITVSYNTATPITLTGTAYGGRSIASYPVVASPTHGSLSGTAPNLTYTPSANYSGSDTFTFQVSDGHSTSIAATVVLAVMKHSTSFDSSGNLYIADSGNGVVQKINPSGISAIVAGTVCGGGDCNDTGDGGPATSASFEWPSSVTVDSAGNLYIDTLFGNIRKVSTAGTITTYVSEGSYGLSGITIDPSGNLFYADTYASLIYKVNTSQATSIFAGSSWGYSGDDGAATSAEITNPNGVAFDNAGNLYMAQSNYNYEASDTPGACPGSGNSNIRKVSVSGIISTIAGTTSCGYTGDGQLATSAELNGPVGVVVDSIGNVYFSDGGNHVVRKISLSGIISTVAGTGIAGNSGDNGPATSAQLAWPTTLAMDDAGNLYIVDSDSGVIRKVDTSGNITTFSSGFSQPEAPAYNFGTG